MRSGVSQPTLTRAIQRLEQELSGTLVYRFAHDRNVWKYETVPQHGTKRAYRSAKVLGGGSSINAMAYVRGQKHDYAAWQEAAATPANGRIKTCFPSSWRRKTTTPPTTNITASMVAWRSSNPRASTR